MAQIKQFKTLISPYLGYSKKFVSYKSENLLAPGENYGSEVLKIEIKLLDENYEDEIIQAIAKTTPPNEILANMFNVKETFKREIEIYRTHVPSINAFAKEKGIDELLDCCAKYLGGRISLDPNAIEADQDAVILLENLVADDYETIDRYVGFDLDTAKMILEDLAKWHAGTIAYKLANPEEFQIKIMPILQQRAMKDPPTKEVNTAMITSIAKALKPELVQYVPQISEGFDLLAGFFQQPSKPTENFGTLIHNDLWVNNIMIKVKKGKPVKSKFVDFQTVEYGSPGNDLLLFLYTSVELSVLEENLDNLIRFYHDKFIEILIALQVDTSEFGFEKLKLELDRCCQMEFIHIMFMLKVSSVLKGKVKKMAEIGEDDLPGNQEFTLHENYYKKLNFVISDFVKREWL